MKEENTTLKNIISYGIDSLEDINNVKVELSVKDLIFIYKTVEELRNFFHNREHYKSLEVIHEYISGDMGGMFDILNEIYCDRLDKYLNPEIENILESNNLDCPQKPFYYKK